MSKNEKLLKEKLNFYSSLGLEKFAITKTFSKNEKHWRFRNKHQFIVSKPLIVAARKRKKKIYATITIKKRRRQKLKRFLQL